MAQVQNEAARWDVQGLFYNPVLRCIGKFNARYWCKGAGVENEKGCDIGYALAVSSCEGVSSVDACTVAAVDVITAFAVPNPSCSSQGSWFFRVWWLDESPRRGNHPAYFGWVNCLNRSFQPSTCSMLVRPNWECSDSCHKFRDGRALFC